MIKFTHVFGYGSSLMIKLFECFISENIYYNQCADIRNIVLSCKAIYNTYKIFHSKRILLWTSTKDFDQNKLNLVRILYYNCDQPLTKDVLPNSLTHLTFGYYFNQPLTKDVLPNNLTQLTFGHNFNQSLTKDVLPNNLTQLTFGTCFNQPLINDVLTNNLTRLTFDSYFIKPLIKDIFLYSLTHIIFIH